MQLRDKRELRQAEMAMLDYLMKKAGMRTEQRNAVLASGPGRAEFVKTDKRDSNRPGGVFETST